MDLFEAFVSQVRKARPSWAVVLGSGLGEAPLGFETRSELPFQAIPHFAEPSVQGHTGKICFGTLDGIALLVSRGRLHYYEGHSWEKILRMVELFSEWHVKRLLLTNAAGGLNPRDAVGDLVLLRGHFFLQSLGSWNSRTTAWEGYSQTLSAGLIQWMKQQGKSLSQGLYAAVTGPSYETPAEIRALARMGCDLVGMSTAKEAMRFRELGGEVVAVSCVTNKAAGLGTGPLDHSHITQVAKQPVAMLSELIRGALNL